MKTESQGRGTAGTERPQTEVGSGRDPGFITDMCRRAGPLFRRYFPGDVSGLENLPEGAALMVGNHNGGMLTPDTWLLTFALNDAFGPDGVPYALGHSIPLKVKGVGSLLTRAGVVHAGHGNGEALFAAGKKVMVYPGGDEDSYRPWRKRHQVVFGGRTGYIRLALRAGVPIVPVVAAGAHEVFVVIDDLQGLARLVGANGRLRTKVWPLIFSLPWGFTLGPIFPVMPFPVPIDIALLPAIHFDRHGTDAAADDAYVRACADQVESAMQAGLDALNAQRAAGPSRLKRLLRGKKA